MAPKTSILGDVQEVRREAAQHEFNIVTHLRILHRSLDEVAEANIKNGHFCHVPFKARASGGVEHIAIF